MTLRCIPAPSIGRSITSSFIGEIMIVSALCVWGFGFAVGARLVLGDQSAIEDVEQHDAESTEWQKQYREQMRATGRVK